MSFKDIFIEIKRNNTNSKNLCQYKINKLIKMCLIASKIIS